MLMETMSVREARAQLTKILARFRGGDRTPVRLGSHRKTEAVLVPVGVFEELASGHAGNLAEPVPAEEPAADAASAPAPRSYAGRGVDARRAERRARFIDAALTVYADKGFANTALTDVCAAAKLSRRQFYELFDSTEELLVAAYDDCQQFFRTAALQALAGASTADPASMMRTAIDALFAAAEADRRRMRVTYVEIVGASRQVEHHREQVREQWAVFLNGLRTQMLGVAPLPEDAVMFATSALVGAMNGLMARWCLHEPDYPRTELVDITTAIMTTLLSGDPPRWRAGAPSA
ncbi:TetR family transcriptional regulator [Nocardia brasiliensis]|uniref:TetR family transcriptional regulator n=2 Tax=Nocardia brasiliensis TaxID=37326 RepID=A0A6G9XYY1_NOCBR|nr:TetR family transcriptional regulator [Nocardia brasiliensis]